jgi:hypothetical protein
MANAREEDEDETVGEGNAQGPTKAGAEGFSRRALVSLSPEDGRS